MLGVIISATPIKVAEIENRTSAIIDFANSPTQITSILILGQND